MMQAFRSIQRSSFLTPALSPVFLQKGEFKIYDIPVEKDMEIPEKNKLKVYDKVPQLIRPYKMQKKLRLMRGPEEVHNFLLHKQFGIVALQGGRLKHCHFEMIRMAIIRMLDSRMFAIWRIDPPWQPVTRKSQGSRMGGGKGSVHHYVTPVKVGRVIIEVAGNCEYFEVEKGLKDIALKLPFKAEAVSQEILEQKQKRENELEENNVHPWTWKYMIQNNMGGCHKWISRYDLRWFNKYV